MDGCMTLEKVRKENRLRVCERLCPVAPIGLRVRNAATIEMDCLMARTPKKRNAIAVREGLCVRIQQSSLELQ